MSNNLSSAKKLHWLYWVFLLEATGVLAASYFQSTGSYHASLVVSWITGPALVITIIYAFIAAPKETIAKEAVRPVLRTWKYNDFLVAAADADYDLADQIRYRIALARNENPKEYAPIPLLTAYFSGPETIGRLRTGNEGDFAKLAAQCRVQNSRIFVPNVPMIGTTLAVSLPELYRLVFGKEEGDAAYARTYPDNQANS